MKKMNLSAEKKVVLENFFSLGLLQVANYVLPLITVPYLVRVIGPEKFGLTEFARAFMQYFIIVTDLGFNLSATREISINRENHQRVSEIFSTIMLVRIGLMLLSSLVLWSLVGIVPRFSTDKAIYFLSFGVVIGNVFFPLWLFQGMERMKFVTILNVTAKLIFTVSIFVVVKDSSDYLYVPLTNSLGQIIAAVLSLWLGRKYFNIRWLIPNLEMIKTQVSASFYFFLSRLSVALYTVSNTFVLGMLTNNEITGYYAATDKLIKAIEGLLTPIVNTLYPYMANKKDKPLFKKILVLGIIAAVLCFSIIFIFSAIIVRMLYGPEFAVVAGILRLFSLEFLATFPSVLLGLPFLAALGQSKYFNNSVIIGSIFHVLALLLIIPFINVYLVVLITLCTETIVLMIRIYGVRKTKLWVS